MEFYTNILGDEISGFKVDLMYIPLSNANCFAQMHLDGSFNRQFSVSLVVTQCFS